jgi:hypothetical protein
MLGLAKSADWDGYGIDVGLVLKVLIIWFAITGFFPVVDTLGHLKEHPVTVDLPSNYTQESCKKSWHHLSVF